MCLPINFELNCVIAHYNTIKNTACFSTGKATRENGLAYVVYLFIIRALRFCLVPRGLGIQTCIISIDNSGFHRVYNTGQINALPQLLSIPCFQLEQFISLVSNILQTLGF